MEKLISVDFQARMGFLKKPDINEGIYLTYNMLHKPALLGILGAIIGLEGYRTKDELPEYYQKLKDLKVGIRPLNTERGNFSKTVVQYNNSVGYASHEAGGNLIVAEQILICPAFRCYVRLSENNTLHQQLEDRLKKVSAEYLPYLGKNEYSLWWDDYQEYDFLEYTFDVPFKIVSIFMKGKEVIKDIVIREKPALFTATMEERQFACFEELPVDFDEQLFQYRKEVFAFTNFTFPKKVKIEDLYRLDGSHEVIQLF